MYISVIRGIHLFLVLLLVLPLKAQQIDFKTDLETLNRQFSQKLPDPYRRPYMYKGEPSVIKKLNPVNVLFGSALYVYQNVFSKQISASCMYSPSCSDFSKNAISEYGAIKGGFLTVDRLHRCNIFSSMDLKDRLKDSLTHRYPDPVSRYKTVKIKDGY